MNGVEILSSEAIYETDGLLWLIPTFAGVGLLICFVIAIINWIEYGFDGDGIMLMVAGVIIGFFIGVLGYLMSIHETDVVSHIEYKVIADDSVSMNEFLDKYEILDQEGKIYTVKEK